MIDLGAYREINRRPDRRELLKFGLLFLVVLPTLAFVQHHFYHRAALARGLAIAGVAVFLLSWLPPIARGLYVAWMALGVTIGMVTTPIIMGVIFFLLFAPIGILFSLIKRDAMKRTVERDRASYWESYPETKSLEQYFKQY